MSVRIFFADKEVKMKKRIISILILVIASVMLLSGCSATAATRPQPEDGTETFTITGECSAYADGDKIVVSAASDIATGTCGTLSVYSTVGVELAKTDIVQGETNGKLETEFKIEDSWPDDVYAYLVFDTDQSKKQPDEIIALYGKQFANLVGDNVVWSSKGCAVVFQSELVKVR